LEDEVKARHLRAIGRIFEKIDALCQHDRHVRQRHDY